MFPRFRSYYGKLIIVAIVALCFTLYIKVLNVEDALTASKSHQRHSHGIHSRNQALKSSRKTNHDYEGSNKLPPEGALIKVDGEEEEAEEAEEEEDNEIEDLEENEIPAPNIPQTAGENNEQYELSILLDLKKQVPGLGNEGKAVHLHGKDKELGDAIYKKIALNQVLSERLSYNRTVADSRHPLCLNQHYDVAALPTISVIIIFYNEPYSVLMRTVHSTLNTCNERILKEIILVDDGSTNVELGAKMDYYIKTRITNGKVQVLRLENRLGLIRARLAGARIATGDVLIFLDAHCEANIGWCEPLVDRIRESRTSVLVPIIDVIDSKDFQYSTNGYKSFQVGGFQWSGHFDWINISKREKKRQQKECKHVRETCPAYSPTMAGGLFAIDRHYFWEIGSYDEQMDGWGGENLEMSFRIWQCGGTIETMPCSRVGHVFRDFHPYKFPNDRDTHGINTARMALVWMDDYVNIFFLNRPDLKFHPDIGDVTHRVMLRKKLRCKSFDWYLKNIYPEKFVPTKNVISYGRIKAADSNLCLDDLLQNNEKPYNLGLYTCGKPLSKSQFFSFTNSQVLRNELSCATVQQSDSAPPHVVVMVACLDNDDYNEQWNYENERFVHVNSGLCLDHRGLKNMDDVVVTTCHLDSQTQRWKIEHD